MSKTILHITNGDSLTDYLRELDYKEDILTWREMLCEGPTVPLIDSEDFFNLRKAFLSHYYNINPSDYNLRESLQILDNSDKYDEIHLWFEYDLFCHINLIAVISLLHQKEINIPLYLVCSGRVDGEKYLMGLGELNPQQLRKHHDNRVLLTNDDIDLAVALWRTYCCKDHNIFKPYITQNSSFKYLTNCLKAHLKRFPNQKTGLCIIEENILKLIKDKDINSEHHLLGYCLNYQGYYGFGDSQFRRMIAKLSDFFEEKDNQLQLTRKGHEALIGEVNFSKSINNDIDYGGISRLDYQFNISENKLIKTVSNVN
ncbi:DUF1835 domain-containing protein [Winogradskyella sp. PC-19]|uniref:DUF1835 domain-containing protein n=1 Tax=unclassified Winogradskyella TaxID=2615021 RepID=UPI000B3D3512|nr:MULTISPECIES: DUF1835 domain-containing protein [unclassified Winogradskyella]ARV08555.1 DUF1835 domain-containing protein [Winogradskyella sp. PC-19]RZN74883.1 MAG: DUF1835 domain-containing protein [Winogradskyella sp.]